MGTGTNKTALREDSNWVSRAHLSNFRYVSVACSTQSSRILCLSLSSGFAKLLTSAIYASIFSIHRVRPFAAANYLQDVASLAIQT